MPVRPVGPEAEVTQICRMVSLPGENQVNIPLGTSVQQSGSLKGSDTAALASPCVDLPTCSQSACQVME